MSLARWGVTALLLAWFVCPATDAAARERYVLTTSKNSPPFSFMDQQGNPQGIVVDFWKMWAEKTGAEVQFRLDDWQRTLELVKSGEVDAHAGLYYSDTRHEYLDFSTGYLSVTTSVFVLDKLDVKSLEELGDLPLATSAGYFAAEFLRARYPHLRVRLYPNNESVIKSALASEVLAFAMEYPVAQYYLSMYEARGRFRVLRNLFTEKFHAGARKDNADLLKIVNRGIGEISDDDMEQLYRKWALEDTTIPEWVLTVITIGGVALAFVLITGHWILLKMELRRKTAELLDRNRAMEIMNFEMVEANKTIQSQVSQLASLSKDKDEIVFIVAREMQTTIRELLDTMERASWSAEEEREKAVQKSKKVLHVIDEITRISEIEYENYQGKMQKINLGDFLKERKEEFQKILMLREVDLALQVPPHEITVFVHREDFASLCKNLLVSALRSVSTGGKLSLILETREGEEEERAVLTFRWRPEESRGEPPEGASGEEKEGYAPGDPGGLGIAFINKLVDLHRGHLRFGLEPEGPFIQIDLPLARKVVKRYEDVAGRLQTGDLVLFKGLYLYGHLVSSDEDWTHIGMVVRMPGIAGPLLWESTLQGEIPDQELSERKSGPQLVSLQERLKSYETDIYAVRFLKVARNAEMLKRLYEFIVEVHRLPFPTELQILKRVFKARLLKRLFTRKTRFKSIFCSELIAESYMRMDLLAPYPPSSSYFPVDFSSKKELPLLRGAYLGAEIHIDLPEKKYVPRDPSFLAQAGHGRI